MDNHATAGATEDRTAGEHLRANRRRLPIAWQASHPLKLGQEIEEQPSALSRTDPPILSKSDPGILSMPAPRCVMTTMEHHDAEGPEEAM